MGRRRASTASLLVIFAALAAVLTSLPHLAESSGRHHHHHSHVQSRGHGGEDVSAAKKRETRQWPCCDNCGGCTKSIPPQCQCMDAAPRGCHPACRDCVKSALGVHPPMYQCMDRIPNFCQRRCNAVTAR
ncbi:unnamed protein product [Alopecurus aequalis]